ncbi:MAG TPA: FISUMP domain-containing protein, partial [Bacteroidales bacterium]|nr:FISUMP domain-containing protein [Bacteroidales bacterium]
ELSLGTIEFVTVPYAFTARDVIYIDANEANDGDVLIFNAMTGKFEPGQVSAGSVTWENVQDKPTDLNDFTNEAGYLKTESQTLSDVLSINNSANSQKITDLANPDNAQDAATKAYVDQLSSSFDLLLNLLEDNGMVVVDFSANLTNIWLGNSISFTDNSILQANQWNWDFGDGTSSTEQNPSHIYTTGGTYSVSLTVSNGALNSTKTKNDYIVVADYETFTDIRDGKIYKKVQIGSQTWMAENLAYAPSSGNYWAYNNDDLNVEIYGYLYDWNTAMNNEVSSNTNPSGVQGICPAGWHLPSNAEWTQLTNFLGENAGGKLKETGTVHWDNPNEGATNEYGFTARPGGYYLNGYSFKIGENGYWWSTTENNSDNAWIRILAANGNDAINANLGKNFGLSVRCVKN